MSADDARARAALIIQVSVDDVVTGLLYVAVVVALLVWLVPR